jgi:hypothetical protein
MGIKKIITEAINDVINNRLRNATNNIVEYIKSFGKKGKLPEFKGDLREIYKPYLKQAFDWACENDIENVRRYGDVWFNREFNIEVVGSFTFNKRGLIYVERNIDIDVSKDVNELNYKSVGECWSWKKKNARNYCSSLKYEYFNNTVSTVTICGYVHPNSVDWLETIYLNSYNMKNETEIRMNDNALVEVVYILIDGVKFSIGGHYLINASSDKYNKNREKW